MSNLHLAQGRAPDPSAGKTRLFAADGQPVVAGVQYPTLSLGTRAYNYVRNSGFWFAQRQDPGTATTYSNLGGGATKTLTADGWAINNENASVQYQRGTTIGITSGGDRLMTQANYFGNFTKITNAGKIVISHQIETSDVMEMTGRKVRLSFWAKAINTNTTTFRVILVGSFSVAPLPNVQIMVPNAWYTLSYPPFVSGSNRQLTPLATVTPINGTATKATSGDRGGVVLDRLSMYQWTFYSAVFDLGQAVYPSASGGLQNLAFFIHSLDQVPVASGIALAQVQLTIGEAVREYEAMSTTAEFRRVQRMYTKSFNVETNPQTAVTFGQARGATSAGGATANQPLGVRFPVTMGGLQIASAITTFYNPAAANAFVRNTVTNTDASATAAANISDAGMDILFTGLGPWNAGQAVAVQYTIDRDL